MEEEIQKKKLQNQAKLDKLEQPRQAMQRLDEIQARLNRKRSSGPAGQRGKIIYPRGTDNTNGVVGERDETSKAGADDRRIIKRDDVSPTTKISHK